MVKIKKNSNELDAMQYNGKNANEIMAWSGGKVDVVPYLKLVCVKTSGGNMYGTEGDYIVQDENGDFCLYKPDFFEQEFDIIDWRPE